MNEDSFLASSIFSEFQPGIVRLKNQFVTVQLLYGKVLYPAIHAENFHLFRRSVEYLYVHGVVLVDIFSIELTIPNFLKWMISI